ncbi:MAG: hypothetical protein JWP02_3210 [Acidimicrobiales bacterium]|nr:hypothetical protein [Acidimicrobiales bacterium]
MKLRSLHLRSARRDDEAGAILILSVLFITVMVVACALAVDLGFQAQDRRNDHKVADLVSLDAVRALDDINGACDDTAQQSWVNGKAAESALRNGYNPAASGHTLNVDIGSLDANKNFTIAPAGQKCWPNSKAVRVTVGSVTDYQFLPGTAHQIISAISAVAGSGPWYSDNSKALYQMGSFVGSIDSNDSALLNRVLGKMLKGSDLTGSLVSWQGLASTGVTLDALKQRLSADGVDVGTDDKLMNSQIQLTKLFQAESEALSNGGTVAATNASVLFAQMAAAANGSSTASIGQIMGFSQGQGSAAAAYANSTFLPSLAVATAAAQLANGNNFSVADLGLSIPGVTKTAFSFTAISPPVQVGYDKGASSDTNQVHITVTPTLNAPVNIPNVVGATLTGDLPLTVDGGGAHGILQDLGCITNPGLLARVQPKPYTTATGPANSLALKATVLGISQAVANVTLQASQVWPGTTPPDHQFVAPTDFPVPPVTAGPSVRMGSNTVGLDTQAYSAQSTLLGVVIPGVTLTTSAVNTASVNGLTTSILPLINSRITRLTQLLGLEIGGADVAPNTMFCAGQIGQGGTALPVLVS